MEKERQQEHAKKRRNKKRRRKSSSYECAVSMYVFMYSFCEWGSSKKKEKIAQQ